jgi:hypothetical protein
VKLAVVVQRYGTEINGGAELLARSLAERLTRFADVQVLTTCAKDYITWRNELPAGTETVNGITVHRFPVSRPRDPREFGYRSRWVFEQRHSMRDELRWLECGGPRSTALIRHIVRTQNEIDFFLFVSFRYYHAFHGPHAVASKAVLIPTAERDPAVGMSIFAPVFRGVRAMAYLTPEEKTLIESVAPRASWRAWVRRFRNGRMRTDSGASTTSGGRLRSMSAASIRTRDARSCSATSSAMPKRIRPGSIS